MPLGSLGLRLQRSYVLAENENRIVLIMQVPATGFQFRTPNDQYIHSLKDGLISESNLSLVAF